MSAAAASQVRRVDVDEADGGATARQLHRDRATEPTAGTGDEHREILEIMLDCHGFYSSASFHASPSRTIMPAVGSQKWVPMISTFLLA